MFEIGIIRHPRSPPSDLAVPYFGLLFIDKSIENFRARECNRYCSWTCVSDIAGRQPCQIHPRKSFALHHQQNGFFPERNLRLAKADNPLDAVLHGDEFLELLDLCDNCLGIQTTDSKNLVEVRVGKNRDQQSEKSAAGNNSGNFPLHVRRGAYFGIHGFAKQA